MDNTTKTSKSGGEGQAKTVLSVMAIMFMGKAAGFVRGILISGQYGTGNVMSEAFSYASLFPRTFLDVLFASAFTASFIPVFSACMEKRGKDGAFRLANSFMTLTLVLTTAVTAVLVAGAGFIMRAYLMKNTDAEFIAGVMELGVPLLRIMLPTIILSGAAYTVTGVLQSMNEFRAPAAMSLVSNLLIIVYMLFFIDKFGIYGLAAVFVLGWATQLIIQLPALRKKEFRFKPRLDLKEPGLKEIGRLMIPAMVSSWALPINLAVNTAVVGEIAGAAALGYADNLYSVIAGVFVLSVTNVMFTKFSRLTASDKTEELGESLATSSRGMLFFLLPLSAGVFVLAPFIIRLGYERGAFTAESTRVTADALRFFALGMAGFGLQNVLSRGFFARKDVRRPLAASLIAIAANAILSFALVGPMGIGGPALASSVSITLAGVFLFISLIKKKIIKPDIHFAADLFKMFFLAGTMAVIVYICYDFMYAALGVGKLMETLAAVIAAVIGVAWYLAGAYFLRVKEARDGFAVIMGRWGKRG